MMKGLVVEENMSNLTSASSEISGSSGTRYDNTSDLYYAQYSSASNQEPQLKRKRRVPGHPDPGAEVIALTPQTLLATNRFFCDICQKGFQRDQNLQLHRRGHNLPWKLKKRNIKEARKKVYVCPEPTCLHHDPLRALGDLTGIKKHFFRKHHAEKKWKCEKCSKCYAVHSDWKAHSKICGTREYICDCGTVFSRRDYFITHRASCDALTQESGRLNLEDNAKFHSHVLQAPSLKREQEFNLGLSRTPSWLASPMAEEVVHDQTNRALDFSSSPLFPTHVNHENPNPTTTLLRSFHSITSSPQMSSATPLMQKASQIGVTMSKITPSEALLRPHLLLQEIHVPEYTTRYMASSSAFYGMVIPSREE
ncbi:protein indeterminate-domain 7-like [Abrus precatorius]|uniref:Protein indeterminate-domain 7-like n=1 Tax=Abrus precatorius TaxID=3816 RepID=A0A8B8JS66_ABRPR|nr:protein indeterminate-domain 7-like [Abrus precatorius]